MQFQVKLSFSEPQPSLPMPFDNTCKFLAEHFSTDIATWLLGTPIALTKLWMRLRKGDRRAMWRQRARF